MLAAAAPPFRGQRGPDAAALCAQNTHKGMHRIVQRGRRSARKRGFLLEKRAFCFAFDATKATKARQCKPKNDKNGAPISSTRCAQDRQRSGGAGAGKAPKSPQQGQNRPTAGGSGCPQRRKGKQDPKANRTKDKNHARTCDTRARDRG